MKTLHTITVKNKKYSYTIQPSSEESGAVFFECEGAGIFQDFLKEDLIQLLLDLPLHIMEQEEWVAEKDHNIIFRVSAEEKKIIQRNAVKRGFGKVSDFMRTVALQS